MPEHYDVIIVGAGMGGGILAARLAQHGVNARNGEKLRIALMDMGPYYKGDPRPGYGIPERRALFANVPGTDDINFMASTPWGTSAGIGGQSLHWGADADLPDEEDHQDWIQETGVDWSHEKFSDAREEITEMFHIQPVPEAVLAPGSLQFRDAVIAMGYAPTRNHRAVLNCIECGHCAENGCKYDSKSGTLVRYIPIAERNGVEILPNTRVEKVLIEKKGARAAATGVVYTRAGKTDQAGADHVMLCCNSTGTSLLLFQSGYGPRGKVKELLVENENVGQHTVMSLQNAVWGIFDEPIKRRDLAWGSSFRILDRGPNGYLNLDINDLISFHGFIGNYLYQMALNEIAPPFGKEHKEYMKKWLHFGAVNSHVIRQNLVSGEISATGRHIINRNHPEILKRAQQGREISREILLKMGARKTSDISKPFQVGSTPSNGTSGGCRAGADRGNSVVNSDFECHDIDNLYICDNGVVPYTGAGGIYTAYVSCYAWRRMVAKHFSRA